MDRGDARVTDPEMEGIPTDYDQLEVSEWGLDWGDISQIRDKLKLTPTERLKAAQDFMNTVIRIRAHQADLHQNAPPEDELWACRRVTNGRQKPRLSRPGREVPGA